MGCISSKTDINDLHPNVFKVMNLDDAGHVLSYGQLEVTDVELVFYQRGNCIPVKWPLRCLRRYGFDAQVFTFESGRRCPTGPGIYAFRCSRAEQLFNLLQAHIQQSRSTGGDDTISREFPVATPTSGPPALLSSLPRGSVASSGTLVDSPLEPNYLEPMRNSRSINLRQANGSSRLSSGPLSPQTPSPISILPSPASNSVYYANDIVIASVEESGVNIRTSAVTSTAISPTLNENNPVSNGVIVNTPGTPTSAIAYMNLTSPTTTPTSLQPYDSERLEALEHLYMNVEPEKEKEILELPSIDHERHCYANLGLGPGEIEIKPRHTLPSVVETPPSEHRGVRQVNYIVLDLERENAASCQTTPLSPVGSTGSVSLSDSVKTIQGYATIDFDKTAALSHSVNPSVELEDEGSRKTRHNSTIHELPVKQKSSSISD